MKLHWTEQKEETGVRYSTRTGRFHASYFRDADGNTPYSVYINENNKRLTILSVGNNRGRHATIARERLEFIIVCLDNNLSFDLLPSEDPKFKDVKYQPRRIPKPPVVADIDGVYIGRVYRHHKGTLYRVLMVTNRFADNSHPDMPKTICYRDIETGHEWSRPFDQFTPAKFQLVPYGEKRETTSTFKFKGQKKDV